MPRCFSLISQDAISRAVEGTWLAPLQNDLYQQSQGLLNQRPHGDRNHWSEAIGRLPSLEVTSTRLDQDAVQCVSVSALSEAEKQMLEDNLMQLHPWRKGPFDMFGIYINTEWRSNLKWNRIQDRISPLTGRTILDVGCGNGYYLYRMLGQGAQLAMGIDPTQLFLAQFSALQKYFAADNAVILPMKSEDFLADVEFNNLQGFDTVFSMGIYYHRRDPDAHLAELHRLLRPGGELILETLVVAGDEDTELEITGRYAQMRNVWSVPTVERLRRRLKSTGFNTVQLIDLTATTLNEQRSTAWMRFDSLEQFLDKMDHQKTIEGHPAPLRATISAQTGES